MTFEEIRNELRELDRHINELEIGILNDRLAKDKILKLKALKTAVYQRTMMLSTYDALLQLDLHPINTKQ